MAKITSSTHDKPYVASLRDYNHTSSPSRLDYSPYSSIDIPLNSAGVKGTNHRINYNSWSSSQSSHQESSTSHISQLSANLITMLPCILSLGIGVVQHLQSILKTN